MLAQAEHLGKTAAQWVAEAKVRVEDPVEGFWYIGSGGWHMDLRFNGLLLYRHDKPGVIERYVLLQVTDDAVRRRLDDLQKAGISAYLDHLAAHPELKGLSSRWDILNPTANVTLSEQV